ncbi:Uncharacterized protein dnl_34200 [Desulfonema limicola]|uniref:Uncharacterized protein n=1 Tax=Desulfonema limicola TaxID=45656 RepID=A0A975B8T1_9BACT|nr:Uncharacterized protein dnl_34200 [Desulfonema limicola]
MRYCRNEAKSFNPLQGIKLFLPGWEQIHKIEIVKFQSLTGN